MIRGTRGRKKTAESGMFCVPCNWDPVLLESLKPFPVHTFYGKLSCDDIGGGRPFYKLPKTDKERAARYIKRVRARGLNFNYVLNSSCTGNKEFTRKGHSAILELLSWIEGAGANYVTVAIPYLAELIKRRFPRMKLCASKMAFVSDARQARFWEDLGADELTVNPDTNRNFRKLELLRRSVGCELVLLVNEACLYRCPFVYYHANSDSHGSQTGSVKPYICYSRLSCEEVFVSDAAEIIKSTFIRPEDLGLYREMGIRKFKLVGRTRPTRWILRALSAYNTGRYDGNLADILGTFSLHDECPGAKRRAVRLSELRSLENLEQLRQSDLFRPHIGINNRALDGFAARFRDFDCEKAACHDCGYCGRYAAKAVRIDDRERERVLGNLRRLKRWVHEGAVMRTAGR